MRTVELTIPGTKFAATEPRHAISRGASLDCAVEHVDPTAEDGWDQRLKQAHPGATLFHSAAWASVLKGAYGYKPVYGVMRDGSGLRALLPLMEADSWLKGRRGIALPFTDDCEPICAEDSGARELIRSAIEQGRERGWKQVEFRGGRKWLGDAPAATSFYGHEITLSAGHEAVFNRLESSVRRAVRKASKSGVTVEFSHSLEALREFYALLCLTRKRHGMPPQPFNFFEKVQEHVLSKGLGVVAIARHQGKALAGAVYFGFGTGAIYKYGASDEREQQFRANNLVMWEAIKWHTQKGFKTLNLGRTSLSNEGLRRFKLGWGASEHKVEYFKYDVGREEYLVGGDAEKGWHNPVFRALPVKVSQWIGAGLYRHWA